MSIHRPASAALCLLVALASLTACVSEPRRHHSGAWHHDDRGTITTDRRSWGHGDDALANRVRAALRDTHGVPANMIEVQAQDGRVLLTGSVGSSEERARAIRAAQQVRGVREVRSMLNLN